MPLPNQELSQQIRQARIASVEGKTSIDRPAAWSDDIITINFEDGEIVSLLLADDSLLRRGTVVSIDSQYAGTGVAVVFAFSFGKTQLPIVVSRGGARGELIACLHPREITLFPKQSDTVKPVRLLTD